MKYDLDELISIILSKSEQLEEEYLANSELKDLTFKQLQCLEIIRELDNPTLTELTDELNITKPSTTAMVEKLDEKGYLKKIKSDTDRRSAHVHLTEKGEEAGMLHVKAHKRFARLLTKNLTDSEKDILVVLLNQATGSFK